LNKGRIRIAKQKCHECDEKKKSKTNTSHTTSNQIRSKQINKNSFFYTILGLLMTMLFCTLLLVSKVSIIGHAGVAAIATLTFFN